MLTVSSSDHCRTPAAMPARAISELNQFSGAQALKPKVVIFITVFGPVSTNADNHCQFPETSTIWFFRVRCSLKCSYK